MRFRRIQGWSQRRIGRSKIFGKLWFCTDILPGIDFDSLEYVDIYPKTRPYAAAAHALQGAMRKEQPNQ